MAQLQSGIEVKVEPIRNELFIEMGKELSTMLNAICRIALQTENCEFEMTIKKGDVKVHVRVKG